MDNIPRNVQRQREYRRRKTSANVRPNPLTSCERQRNCRARRSQEVAELTIHPQAQINRLSRDDSITSYWKDATKYFEKEMKENDFGHTCDVCDRLWFRKDLKKVNQSYIRTLEPIFGNQSSDYAVCGTCRRSLDRGRIPLLSKSNGFEYPLKPVHLPDIDPISIRLISPRLPFMAIRRLRRDAGYGIVGQVINVPVDVNSMVRQLPRHLDDDYAINVAIKRKLIHKSSYLHGHVKKRQLKIWLEYLVQQPLYRHYGISIDWENIECMGTQNQIDEDPNNAIVEEMREDEPEVDFLIARQQTLLWNENNVLDIAPGQNSRPLNIIFDSYAEELSFPQIYLGNARNFNRNISVTPYMMANSEIRRTDRRGATPEHILYMAMKVLRLRVVDGIYNSFLCVRETENVTRRMIEDPQFLNQCVEMNFSFLKSIPNSAQYWLSRKKDLFAMMRQLGKPTFFLTLSASEIQWPDLLKLMHKLSFRSSDPLIDPMAQLDRSKRCHLVNEDPVTCCIYFNKLIDLFMRMLCSTRKYNPFGRSAVVDYFQRIEFQHRGSPHAHILLWLKDDPNEVVSENMASTTQLITNLCSVSLSDTTPDIYANQVHKHTFTCTKRGETSCRFNIPYWPIEETCVLLPIAKDDVNLPKLRSIAKDMKNKLETKSYDSINSFMQDFQIDSSQYLNIIRSTITRPTVLFKRDMSQLYTNTFNPWILNNLKSNMDLQFILDEYSCAAYVVDYINKSNRGTGNLHREIIKLNETNPDMTHGMLLKKLGAKVLNSVELSAQEAAWYLLRQPMSYCSRDVVYIPTCWPCERQKSHKRKDQLLTLDQDSTDVWTKSLIQRYEERPSDLEQTCLADFAAWYTPKSRANLLMNDESMNSDGESRRDDSADTLDINTKYSKRKFSRIIRFRAYDIDDLNNYKREMVTLYVPFRNEQVDILDREKYKSIFDDKISQISTKRLEYEPNQRIEHIMNEYRQLIACRHESTSVDLTVGRDNFVRDVLLENETENFDDFEPSNRTTNVVSMVRTRKNILEKQEYCELMRTTNEKQREIILEIIHRLNYPNSPPIQVFLTGPAGCGKTYALKLMMETFNRYGRDQNILNNSYVACASTGKAAVNLGGTTVHSAFHITQSRRVNSIARETLQRYRQLFANISCIFIDEISMIGSDILHKVNGRLQEITGELDSIFGGMNMIFCGDFRQLPPVNATPVYKGSRSHIEGALLWQSLNFFKLTEVMRQDDILFSSTLTKIGEGQRLSLSESSMIEQRFRTESWCDSNLKGVVRLFHQNHLVDQYNRRAIENGKELVATDVISGYTTNENLTSARTKLHRMSTMETGGLPYLLILAVGYPYMLTTNIDIEDGLVNGAIGVMQFIDDSRTSDQGPLRLPRVWLKFDSNSIGLKARSKNNPHRISRQTEIDASWTPISPRMVSINLGGELRCKREQLPLTPACAITIHKSQGGTFDKAVVYYDKSQQTQLVYVALSRVTNIGGLYLVNAKNDFTFHHKNGSSAPSIREIRDEYARLANHPLPTISSAIKSFLTTKSTAEINISTINAQSLVAHVGDIETDRLITLSDIIAVTETWMDNLRPVTINGYTLVAEESDIVPGGGCRRIAGGVAIYVKTCSIFSCRDLDLATGSCRIGNFTATELLFENQPPIVLSVFYIHPGVSRLDLEQYLRESLARFTPPPDGHTATPLMITGDFNIDIHDNVWLVEFFKKEFHLSYIQNALPTTLGSTKIDHTYLRRLEGECMSFVAYFSYHRPLFTKLSINKL